MNNWQVFTPKFIVKFMLKLWEKYNCFFYNSNVLEPSFWKGIFLKEIINSNYNNINLYWIEKDTKLYNMFYNNKSSYNINLINDDFINFAKNNNLLFDLIIWNPPYVKNKDISKDTKKYIKKLKNCIDNWNWNLYYYFISESIKKLKKWWKLIFITPITFLTNTNSKSLRDLIFDNWAIKEIYSMEEEKIFDKVSIETIIWVFEKWWKKEDIKLWIIKKWIDLKKMSEITENNFIIKNIKHFLKKDFYWNIYNINNNNDYTKKITDIFDISVWMVSWLDKAFEIDEKLYQLLSDKEKEFVKIFLKTKDIINKTWWKKYIFIEKWFFKTEQELKNNCPNIYNHLLKHKDRLLNRYWSKNLKFWEWATVRNKKIFEKNDIFFVIPCITRNSNLWFYKIKNNKNILYSSWDVITLTFKENISDIDKDKYEKILLSKKYTLYIQSIAPRKWNRKMFWQKFLSSIYI